MRYYFPDRGMTATDARGPIGQDCVHKAWSACEALDHCYDNYGLKGITFPVRVVLIDDMSQESAWIVTRSTRPVFSAIAETP